MLRLRTTAWVTAALLRGWLISLLVLSTQLDCRALQPPLLREEGSDSAVGPEEIDFSDRVLYGREPVDYSGAKIDDAITQAVARHGDLLKSAKAESRSGYLKAVLQILNVPVESQLLVFSKTARVQPPVGPKSPRAIYFNDEVTVGWTPTSRELEIAAIDPVKGAVFYGVKQPQEKTSSALDSVETAGSDAAGIRFERHDDCLSCHVSRSTLEVPGLMLKSFVTDGAGRPLNGFSHITHDSPYERRFGGWYVTGSPAGLLHRGNVFGQEAVDQNRRRPGFQAEMKPPVPVKNADGYRVETSDIVAQLVFSHQVEGINLLTRVGMEARLNVRSDAEDRLVRYFVFADEPSLAVPVDRSHSAYASVFEAAVKSDGNGRSLRQLDLQTRLLKYRLSWLIGHRSFAELPPDCRSRLVQRIKGGLQTGEPGDVFGHLPEAERLAALAIAAATLPFW
ncbi:hypothetical protein GC176_14220 [bacterium]|nr:hypothetical protein [bacterium]